MAPATTRSSSISSASTASSKCSNDSIKKKFGCSFPSCGKSFSRSEHLHRHALNHKDGNNTCLRCSAHFRRRDLLDRHMARHREKDEEAGGEGLGVLATRKRLWRDGEGNIVNARRPSYTQEGTKRRQLSHSSRKDSTSSFTSGDEDYKVPARRQAHMTSLQTPPNTMSRSGSSQSSTIVVDTGAPGYIDLAKRKADAQEKEIRESWLQTTTLPSPPLSSLHSGSVSQSRSPSPELPDLDSLYEDSWPVTHNGLPQIINNSPVLGRHSEYPASPSWGPQPYHTFMGAMAEPETSRFDEVFRPEAGLYEWQQAWNTSSSNHMLSSCREEKFEPFEKREREWSVLPGFAQESSFRRTFGMGTC